MNVNIHVKHEHVHAIRWKQRTQYKMMAAIWVEMMKVSTKLLSLFLSFPFWNTELQIHMHMHIILCICNIKKSLYLINDLINSSIHPFICSNCAMLTHTLTKQQWETVCNRNQSWISFRIWFGWWMHRRTQCIVQLFESDFRDIRCWRFGSCFQL